MEAGALLPYEQGLIDGARLLLRHGSSTVTSFDLERWLLPADDVDRAVLTSAVGPALDVGCGPGRIVKALQDRGIRALGIDIAQTAVTLARERGADARRCDVFTPIPDEGSWRSVLLLDGNIGIGGNPEALLARIAELSAPGARVIVETHEDPDTDVQLPVRFARGGRTTGPTFRWALIGRRALGRCARSLDYQVLASWTTHGRSFLILRAPGEAR